MRFQQVVSFGAVTAVASAHTIFTNLVAGGTKYPVSHGIRTPTYDGPIQDVSTNYITCNGGPNPTMSSDKIIEVKAGETVQAVWRHTLTSTEADIIDASHKGPTMAYLKKVTDAKTDSGIGNGWFKIQEKGYNAADKRWAVDDLIADKGLHSITIPTCIENGQYLLRAELIALHGAGSSGGAQFYMECAQINVSGGTASGKPATVSFPGAYKASDPGITVNIYQTLNSYTIPGPRPFTCGAGSGPAPVEPTTPAPAPTTLVTSTAPAPTTAPAQQAPLYSQCGGDGWKGPTSCASGTCQGTSQYYRQCLP